MADIFHDLPIGGTTHNVFAAVSTPAGLSAWWSLRASGVPELGAQYKLDFGPQHQWRAVVTRFVPGEQFELEMGDEDDDWRGTRVGFELIARDPFTLLQFRHTGWPRLNDHYRQSCYCWAMYLKCLKRYIERGEVVPYADRFNA